MEVFDLCLPILSQAFKEDGKLIECSAIVRIPSCTKIFFSIIKVYICQYILKHSVFNAIVYFFSFSTNFSISTPVAITPPAPHYHIILHKIYP